MKCPKCGYISFDHNDNCPKCNKPLNEQAGKMNLPRYEPAPPFLLGSLLGQDDAPMAIEMPDLSYETPGNHQEAKSAHEIKDADSFDREADMEISLDDAPFDQDAAAGNFSLPGLAEAVAEMDADSGETDDFSIDLDDFSHDESPDAYAHEAEEPDEIGLEHRPPASGETPSGESDHESGFEFLDLSSDVEEHEQADPAEPGSVSEDQEFELPFSPLDEESDEPAGKSDEAGPEGTGEMTSPVLDLDEESDMLALPEEEEEIAFDPEHYSAPLDQKPENDDEKREAYREDEGIPFDPEALDFKFDRHVPDEPSGPDHTDDLDFDDIPGLELEKSPETEAGGEEPVKEDFTIELDDFEFEVLESDEDEEKK